MSDIIPKRVKGTHTFHASQQTRGAASNIPASSGRGKGQVRAKGKEKGKEKEQEHWGAEIITEPYNTSENDDNQDDRLSTIFSPSPVPTSAIHLSTSPSVSATSSNKRKFSALDNDSSLRSEPSGSHQSSSKKHSGGTGANAIDNLSVTIAGVSSSINDMTAKHRLSCIQQEAHTVLWPRQPRLLRRLWCHH